MLTYSVHNIPSILHSYVASKSQLSQVFSSLVRKFSNIHCRIGGCILDSNFIFFQATLARILMMCLTFERNRSFTTLKGIRFFFSIPIERFSFWNCFFYSCAMSKTLAIFFFSRSGYYFHHFTFTESLSVLSVRTKVTTLIRFVLVHNKRAHWGIYLKTRYKFKLHLYLFIPLLFKTYFYLCWYEMHAEKFSVQP